MFGGCEANVWQIGALIPCNICDGCLRHHLSSILVAIFCEDIIPSHLAILKSHYDVPKILDNKHNVCEMHTTRSWSYNLCTLRCQWGTMHGGLWSMPGMRLPWQLCTTNYWSGILSKQAIIVSKGQWNYSSGEMGGIEDNRTFLTLVFMKSPIINNMEKHLDLNSKCFANLYLS